MWSNDDHSENEGDNQQKYHCENTCLDTSHCQQQLCDLWFQMTIVQGRIQELLVGRNENLTSTQYTGCGLGLQVESTAKKLISYQKLDIFATFCLLICIHLTIYFYKQELSCRKQIAHQLRTQYVEGINDNPVTLKSRLRVTQGHWKRNHWADHTRLTISRVIWRWILSWPWNVSQRSLKVMVLVAFERLSTVSYSPSIVTMAVSLAISEIFNVKE